MNYQKKNIIVVAAEKRFDYFKNLIGASSDEVSAFASRQLYEDRYFDIPPDIVIIDVLHIDHERLYELLIKHSSEILVKVPFIFVFPAEQKLGKESDFFNSPFNFFLHEPLDLHLFKSIITAALHIARLERKVEVERGLIEGEKQLISSINQIININKIQRIKDESAFRSYLQFEFTRQMEIVSSAKGAFFGFFENSWNDIHLKTYDNPPKSISIRIDDSELIFRLKEKIAVVVDTKRREYKIAAEMEKDLGVELSSLMLVPLTIFNKPYGCLILFNKVEQSDFENSDVIFASLALHKISFYLEKRFVENLEKYDENDPLMKFLLPEKKIREEQTLYKQMLSSVDFGVVVFMEDYKIVFINNSALRLLGANGEKSNQESLPDFFQKKDFEQFERIFKNSDFPIVREEILLSKKSDPNYYIGFSIYKVEENESKKFIMVFSEISDSKKIQTEIVRMDRMASLGILSSGIAHEIRNPLAGMKAMSETLREQLDPESNHIEYVDRILRQINRLDDLLKSFFSYANPLRPDPKVVHIKNIIKEVLPLFNRKLHDEGIIINQHYEKDLYNIFVDASQIEQVLFNLLLNAIDAMSDGGGVLTIDVRNSDGFVPVIDRRRNLNNTFSDKFIQIKISDTGAGIPKDIQDRIFSPFFTTKTNGTGLGLAIVYKIVQNHGGKIELCSGEGEGTQFCIYLPAHDEDNDEIFIE
jgi:PAS domain S-box-containing protein